MRRRSKQRADGREQLDVAGAGRAEQMAGQHQRRPRTQPRIEALTDRPLMPAAANTRPDAVIDAVSGFGTRACTQIDRGGDAGAGRERAEHDQLRWPDQWSSRKPCRWCCREW